MTADTSNKIKLGPYTSKIHKDELLEVLDLWEYAPGVKEKIGALIEANADQLKGPHLFLYYNPRPSKDLVTIMNNGKLARSQIEAMSRNKAA